MSSTERVDPRPTATGRRRAGAARSLADDLRARSDEQLATVLRARPDLVNPVPADLGALATRATTTTSVVRALDHLDVGALQVVEALAALPEPASLPLLVAGLPGMSRRYLAATIARLRDRALLWGPDGELHLVRAVRQAFGDHPGGLGPALAGSRRGVAAYAADPGLVGQALAEAPAEARAALERLVWGPPFGRVAGANRPVTTDTASTPIEWLLARHLLEPLDDTTVVLPREVALVLRDGRLVRDPAPDPPPVAVTAVHQQADVDRSAGQQAFAFVRSVDALLQAWSLAPPAVLRAGGLGVRDLARTSETLDLDEARTAVVIETAYAAGLLAADGGADEVWCPTPAYDSWAARPTAEQWALLAGAWLASTRTPALADDREVSGSRINLLTRDLDRPGTPATRRAALVALSSLPTGSTPVRDDLLAAQDWWRPRRRSPTRRAVFLAALAEGEQLGVTGLGALATHGRVLLETAAVPEPPAAARAAERAPGRTPVPTEVVAALGPQLPSLVDHVLLQADLTAVAPGPLEHDLARELALLADVESTGGATVYRFSAATVRRALDAGRSATDILALLKESSRTPVPQPLEYLVTDVARRHGALRVGVASAYVRCDDPATIATVLADRRSASLGLVRLADTVLAARSPADVVLGRLREAGYAPSAESPDGAVLVLRPQEHRTTARTRPPRVAGEPPPPTEALLDAAVRALRAGEHAAAHRPATLPEGGGSGRLPRASSAEAMALLREALAAQRSVWIGYADPAGVTTERVVEPLRLEGGFLTAYDLRSAQVRTFTVARITAASPVATT